MEADNFPVKKIHGKMPDDERKKHTLSLNLVVAEY